MLCPAYPVGAPPKESLWQFFPGWCNMPPAAENRTCHAFPSYRSGLRTARPGPRPRGIVVTHTRVRLFSSLLCAALTFTLTGTLLAREPDPTAVKSPDTARLRTVYVAGQLSD